MKTKRLTNLGLWLGGLYVALVGTAFFIPEESLGMPTVIFKMAVGSLILPWPLLLEDHLILYPIVGALWFWLIGRVVSFGATRLFPLNHEDHGA